MRKIIFIGFLFIIQQTFTQEWMEFASSENTSTDYKLIQSDATMVEFEITIPGMWTTLYDSLSRVQIKNHSKTDSIGLPELPIISYLTAIPQCDSVIVNIEILDSTLMEGINIYPAPDYVADTIENGGIALLEEFTYNRPFYESNQWYPNKKVETIDKGAIRTQGVVRVQFFPIHFNPSKNQIWVYSKAKVTLSFLNPTGNIHQEVGIFNEVVGNTLINYESNGLNASVSCGASYVNAGTVNWVTELSNQKIV